MKQLLKFLSVALIASVISSAHAQEQTVGDLMIMQPEIRATPKSAPVSAGYLTIKNNGSEDDRLLSANAGFAAKVQLHNMEVVDGVARMRPQKDGIVVPAGGEVTLKQGGLHIMFMKLGEQMQAGESRAVVLTFERAGMIEVNMDVIEIGAMGHSGHGEMKHGETKKKAAE